MKSPESIADPLLEIRSFRESAVNFALQKFESAKSRGDHIEAGRWRTAIGRAESGYWRDMQVNLADTADETLAQIPKEQPGLERIRLMRTREFCLTVAREIRPNIIDLQQIRLSRTKSRSSS